MKKLLIAVLLAVCLTLPIAADSAVIYTQHYAQFFDDNGDPCNGCKLYTYSAGTSTPKATYTTQAGSVENANPVVVDSAGRAVIFLDGSYKFRLETSAGVLIKETDNVTSFGVISGSANSSGLNQESGTSYTLLAADNALIVEFTGSSNATWAFTAAATLGNGWFAYLKNAGTANITVDPAGGELIDGLASYVMYPGEVRLVACDGSAFTTSVMNGFYAAFTASGTFTKPPGYQAFDVEGWGAGGGGGSGGRGAAGGIRTGGGGGGGGGYNRQVIVSSAVGTTETITIGTGGTGGAAVSADNTNGNDGTAGTNSTLGSLLTFYAGGLGTGGDDVTTTVAGAGGGGGGTTGIGANASTSSGGTGGTPGPVGFGGADGADGTNAAGLTGGSAGYGGGGGAGASDDGSITSASAIAGGSSSHGGAGGGCGGGITAANAADTGSNGGSRTGDQSGGGAGGGAGVAGTAGTTFGFGGGGGGAHATTAGAGGAGGVAGGGGGGGASTNGAASGAGGNGGRGEIRIRGIM